MSGRHPVLERLTRWSIARTRILRAAGSQRHQNTLDPEEVQMSLEEAWQVVQDLRQMADSLEADIQHVYDIAEQYLFASSGEE